MELTTANALATSDPVSTENEYFYDFRSQLNPAVESEWAKTNNNALKKKKTKSKKGKATKKSAASNSQKFQSFNLLHECLLEDKG